MKIIKNIFLPALLIISVSVFGQEKNIDIIKTIKTEKAIFLEDGNEVEKKVSISETRKQRVDTKPSQSHLLNQERLQTPIEVEKLILIDDNDDKIFDATATITYKIMDNKIHDLNITTTQNSGLILEKKIILDGERKDAYIIGTKDLPVFGYIHNDNSFVVEYF